MKSLADWLESWCFRISGLLLVSICLIIGWQVFARKILNDSPSWSEPLALLLLLFSVMFASAAGCRNKLHIGLTWFRNKFPVKLQLQAYFFEYLLCGLLGIVMTFYGYAMFEKTLSYQLAGLPVAMGIQYLPLVLGGVLIVFFNVEQLIYFNANHKDSI